MPKPVLSDSLFNADDVATAVLAEANLQIANSSLGVTDITSSFTRDSNWATNGNADRVYIFMGFVFYNLGAATSTNITSQMTAYTIAEPYRPNQLYFTNNLTYQGDFAAGININTDGTMVVHNATQPSGSDATFRIQINGWYRI
tara:strand:- start:39 stop:470 length:432 start_codon:yes stop_codon:yes gene_type:complete